jgi:SAM-dependent methyltransferase
MESMTSQSESAYHEVRLPPDSRRDVLWETLWKHYFSHQVGPSDTVLDLGCGYGNFINNVVAARRIAVDSWPDFARNLQPGIEAHVGSVTDLGFLDDGTIDYAFASNLFEHLTQDQFSVTLSSLRRKIKPNGELVIVQPNYFYAYREYFDDYTHVAVYSHVSLADFVAANGFEIVETKPRFLPLTIKSRLPVWPILIRLYLAMPIKPMGKQMLVRARPLP